MKGYFLEKIFDINYRIATHEGSANRRLAGEAINIYLLPENVIPQEYEDRFLELKSLVETTIESTHSGATPVKLGKIRNSTAVKYIELLIEIESYLRNQSDI